MVLEFAPVWRRAFPLSLSAAIPPARDGGSRAFPGPRLPLRQRRQLCGSARGILYCGVPAFSFAAIGGGFSVAAELLSHSALLPASRLQSLCGQLPPWAVELCGDDRIERVGAHSFIGADPASAGRGVAGPMDDRHASGGRHFSAELGGHHWPSDGADRDRRGPIPRFRLWSRGAAGGRRG